MAIHANDPILGAIHDARAGDADAFRLLYDQYFSLVFHVAYHMLGDYQQAEDIAHDVFVRVYQRLALYDPAKGAFSTWLHQITVNLSINASKRRWTDWFSLDRAVAEGHDAPTPEPHALDTLLDDEAHTEVWEAVIRLPIRYRTVIVLRYGLDLSYDEIATIIGRPIGTVRSRLSTAIAHLQKDVGGIA